MNEIKTKTIFSQKMAGYLMLNGFVLAEMKPNTDGSGRNVFYFKDTPALQSAMNDFMANRSR